MFFLFLNCNVSLPFSHIFLWIVDTDKRMKLILRMPVDLKYFSIFCRFSYGSYGCSHSRRHQPGLPITLFLIFIDLEMKTSLYKALKAIPVTRLRPQICFFIKAKKQKDSPVSEHSHLWNNLLMIAST